MKQESGVTMVELVVVLAIFVVVITVAVNLFASAAERQKSLSREQEVLNQVNYLEELLSRNIRTAVIDTTGTCLSGRTYQLTHQDVASGMYQGVKFLSSDGTCSEFFLDSDGAIKEIKGTAAALPVLSSSSSTQFTIKYLRFLINGDKSFTVDQEPNIQTRVTLALDILTQIPNNPTKEEHFQTTISQRNWAPVVNP